MAKSIILLVVFGHVFLASMTLSLSNEPYYKELFDSDDATDDEDMNRPVITPLIGQEQTAETVARFASGPEDTTTRKRDRINGPSFAPVIDDNGEVVTKMINEQQGDERSLVKRPAKKSEDRTGKKRSDGAKDIPEDFISMLYNWRKDGDTAESGSGSDAVEISDSALKEYSKGLKKPKSHVKTHSKKSTTNPAEILNKEDAKQYQMKPDDIESFASDAGPGGLRKNKGKINVLVNVNINERPIVRSKVNRGYGAVSGIKTVNKSLSSATNIGASSGDAQDASGADEEDDATPVKVTTRTTATNATLSTPSMKIAAADNDIESSGQESATYKHDIADDDSASGDGTLTRNLIKNASKKQPQSSKTTKIDNSAKEVANVTTQNKEQSTKGKASLSNSIGDSEAPEPISSSNSNGDKLPVSTKGTGLPKEKASSSKVDTNLQSNAGNSEAPQPTPSSTNNSSWPISTKLTPLPKVTDSLTKVKVSSSSKTGDAEALESVPATNNSDSVSTTAKLGSSKGSSEKTKLNASGTTKGEDWTIEPTEKVKGEKEDDTNKSMKEQDKQIEKVSNNQTEEIVSTTTSGKLDKTSQKPSKDQPATQSQVELAGSEVEKGSTSQSPEKIKTETSSHTTSNNVASMTVANKSIANDTELRLTATSHAANAKKGVSEPIAIDQVKHLLESPKANPMEATKSNATVVNGKCGRVPCTNNDPEVAAIDAHAPKQAPGENESPKIQEVPGDDAKKNTENTEDVTSATDLKYKSLDSVRRKFKKWEHALIVKLNSHAKGKDHHDGHPDEVLLKGDSGFLEALIAKEEGKKGSPGAHTAKDENFAQGSKRHGSGEETKGTVEGELADEIRETESKSMLEKFKGELKVALKRFDTIQGKISGKPHLRKELEGARNRLKSDLQVIQNVEKKLESEIKAGSEHEHEKSPKVEEPAKEKKVVKHEHTKVKNHDKQKSKKLAKRKHVKQSKPKTSKGSEQHPLEKIHGLLEAEMKRKKMHGKFKGRDKQLENIQKLLRQELLGLFKTGKFDFGAKNLSPAVKKLGRLVQKKLWSKSKSRQEFKHGKNVKAHPDTFAAMNNGGMANHGLGSTTNDDRVIVNQGAISSNNGSAVNQLNQNINGQIAKQPNGQPYVDDKTAETVPLTSEQYFKAIEASSNNQSASSSSDPSSALHGSVKLAHNSQSGGSSSGGQSSPVLSGSNLQSTNENSTGGQLGSGTSSPGTSGTTTASNNSPASPSSTNGSPSATTTTTTQSNTPNAPSQQTGPTNITALAGNTTFGNMTLPHSPQTEQFKSLLQNLNKKLGEVWSKVNSNDQQSSSTQSTYSSQSSNDGNTQSSYTQQPQQQGSNSNNNNNNKVGGNSGSPQMPASSYPGHETAQTKHEMPEEEPDEPEVEEPETTTALAEEEPAQTLIDNLERDITEVWSYKDIYANADAIGLDNEKIHETYVNLGSMSGLNLRRALVRALRGQDVGLAIVGGSISKGGPFSEKGVEFVLRSYFYAIADWWNKIIRPVTGSSMIIRDVSIGGIATDYYSYCLRTHLPDDHLTNIVLWELSANDMRRFEDSNKPRSQPLEQFTRNVLGYKAKPALLYLNFFALFAWDEDLFAHCRNFEDEGENDVAKHYKITSLSWRNMVCPLLKENQPLFTRDELFAEDQFHPSIEGHAQMAYLVIDYIRTEFLKNLVKVRALDIGGASRRIQVPKTVWVPGPLYKDTYLWKPRCYTYMLVDNQSPNNTLAVDESINGDFRYTVVREFRIRSDKIVGMDTQKPNQYITYRIRVPRHRRGDPNAPYRRLAIMSFMDDRQAETRFDNMMTRSIDTKKRFLEGTVIRNVAENVYPGEHELTIRSENRGFLISAIMLG